MRKGGVDYRSITAERLFREGNLRKISLESCTCVNRVDEYVARVQRNIERVSHDAD
jgi:hypothetical protein